MKGGRQSEKYLPAVLTPYMTRYLEHHRRTLLRDPDGLSDVNGVWIGEHVALSAALAFARPYARGLRPSLASRYRLTAFATAWPHPSPTRTRPTCVQRPRCWTTLDLRQSISTTINLSGTSRSSVYMATWTNCASVSNQPTCAGSWTANARPVTILMMPYSQPLSATLPEPAAPEAGMVAICSHPGRRASTRSWTEANPLVDEALGSPRQRAMPAATKAGGRSHARAAEGSRGCGGRIAVSHAEAKARGSEAMSGRFPRICPTRLPVLREESDLVRIYFADLIATVLKDTQ